MPGVIKLVLPNGTKEKEVHYYSTKSWKAIIESWVCLYGDKLENFHVHICPNEEKRHLKNHNYKLT
jgi:hypothetical protein